MANVGGAAGAGGAINMQQIIAAAELAYLRDMYLPTCGIKNNETLAVGEQQQTEEFIASQGLQAVIDFKGMKPEEIGRMVKSHNDSGPLRGRIGFMVQKNLEALAFWVTDNERRNLALVPLTWNEDTMADAKTRMQLMQELRENPPVPKRCEKITTDSDWFTWHEGLENYFGQILGVVGYPILYVIRRDKPAGWDPTTDAETDEEMIMYQLKLNGPEYNADNRTVWQKLKELTQGAEAFEWIRKYERKTDGRSAMIALRSHCEGEDFKTRRITEAERRIKTEKYENEYNYSFDQYSTALQSAYTILEHYEQTIPDRLKVKRLIEGISVSNHSGMLVAIQICQDTYPDNFMSACNYLATKVATFFPKKEKVIGKRKGRYVYETNTRGRGNSGRYHNPGRGGGRGGRFGRGGGGGRGHGHDVPKHINGVNTTNIWKSFTDKEWDMIGQDGRRMINQARDAANGRNDGRGRNVSAVGTHNNRWYRTGGRGRGGAEGSSTGDDTLNADAKEEGESNDKGGSAGKMFGKNMYSGTPKKL
jgi:hypothetical protein